MYAKVSVGIGLGWRIALGGIVLSALLLAATNYSAAGTFAPNAPTNLRVIVVHDALMISLFWQDNSGNEDNFILERSSTGAGGPWSVAALLPADTTMYTDAGLTDGVMYWYRVAASNESGTSSYSNIAMGTASSLPEPPLGDADCNGSVSSVDATLVLQYDAGLIDILVCALFADVNGSGDVNALDATLILQFDAGLLDAFVLPATATGIRGLVTIGPMCPVIQKGVPCPDQPFSAKIVIEDDDVFVISVVSDDDGAFEVGLSPGDYVLVPQSPNGAGPPYAGEIEVHVAEGSLTKVLVKYDSGIR